MQSDIQNVIIEYVKKYKDTPSLTLAKIIYHDYNHIFKNVEAIRNSIRYLRGSYGKKHLKTLINKYGKPF